MKKRKMRKKWKTEDEGKGERGREKEGKKARQGAQLFNSARMFLMRIAILIPSPKPSEFPTAGKGEAKVRFL